MILIIERSLLSRSLAQIVDKNKSKRPNVLPIDVDGRQCYPVNRDHKTWLKTGDICIVTTLVRRKNLSLAVDLLILYLLVLRSKWDMNFVI